MKRRLFQLALLLGFVLPAVLTCVPGPVKAASPAAQTVPSADMQTTYALATEREPVTSLQGQWRFQPGDNPQWAAPALDDSRWALVSSSGDWNEIGYQHLDGSAWYRFRVTLPQGDEHYSLYLPTINTSYQVFADGQLLLTEGKLPPRPGMFRARPVVVDLPATGQRPTPRTVLIALRIWHAPTWSHYRHGGLQGVAEIGRSDLIRDRYETQEQAHLWQYSDDIDLGALEMLAAAVALVLFLTRPTEREFLWFASLMAAEGIGHLVTAWDRLHSNSVLITDLLSFVLGTLFVASALMFFRTLFGGKWSNAFVFALACCGMNALIYPLNWTGAISVGQANLASLIILVPAYGWILIFVRRHAKQKLSDARILRGPVVFLIFASIYSSVIWTAQTFGLLWANKLIIHWRHPFYFTLEDLAQGVFLAAMLVILLRRFTLRSREQDRVHSEIEAARSVQQVLVPESLPNIPGVSIATAYHPAQEVGGDFFQILPMADGTTLIVIGDVAGKGLPAALQVSLVVGTLRALVERTTSPTEILAGLNRSLQGRGPGFATCLALCLSPDRTELTFANAGHIAPYVNGFELRTEPNLPLGIVPEIVFEEARYTLQPGDHLAVLTDGVPEAMHHRELFGFERTGQISRMTADAIAEVALRFGQTDDITVLTVDILPVPTPRTEQIEPSLQPA